MNTSVIIEGRVAERLREEAARRGIPAAQLVELALMALLREGREERPELTPLPSFDGGGRLVDVADREALYRAMTGM